MSSTQEFLIRWKTDRPHLPYRIVDGTTSAMGLEMLTDPRAWIVKDDDTLWDMTQERLCGLFIPPFQRPLVWDEARKISFVESAYLGIHLGTIVFNDALNLPMVEGRFDRTDRWLIDGQQRCNALWGYVNDEFAVFAGTPHEHRWSDLNTVERRFFHRIQIGYTKLQSNDEAHLRLVYDRLNFGGVAHTDDQRALPAPSEDAS